MDLHEAELPLLSKHAAQQPKQQAAGVAQGIVDPLTSTEHELAADDASADANGNPEPADRPGNNIEEERRLLYVGMTRAKHTLALARPLTDARGRALQPSSFLAELPPELCTALPEDGSVPADLHRAAAAVLGPQARRRDEPAPGQATEAGPAKVQSNGKHAEALQQLEPGPPQRGPSDAARGQAHEKNSAAAGAPAPGEHAASKAATKPPITKPCKHPFIACLPRDVQRVLCNAAVKKAKLPAFHDASRLHSWLTTDAKTRWGSTTLHTKHCVLLSC